MKGAALVFLPFILLTAACSSDKPAIPTPTLTTIAIEGTPAPSIRIFALGSTATSDIADMTVLGVRRSREEGADVAPDGFEWVLLDLAVLNKDTRPLAIHAEFVHADGRSFERAELPASATLSAPIAPGAEARGEVAFLVESDMTGGILIYGPGEPRWALELGSIGAEERGR